jgi:5-dehydro-2-deoxygluconokinase
MSGVAPAGSRNGALDLLTVGRVGVDLYPEQAGRRLADVQSFRKMLGGSATNVAVAAARLGRAAGVVTKVGDDGFGEYVRRTIGELGVTGFVGTSGELRTPLAFCEIFPPDEFPLLFYREPTAPDMTLAADDVPWDHVAAARILWVTGTGLSAEPSRETTLACLHASDATESGRETVVDLDYRPMFWSSPDEARDAYRAALRHATVAVGNVDEVSVAVGEGDPDAMLEALLGLGLRLAIVKRGPLGVLAATPHERVEVAPVPVDVVNGLGAGDAFGGALCHGLLASWPLEQTIGFANVAGAIVAGRLGCADAMPTEPEIARALAAGTADTPPHLDPSRRSQWTA